MEGAIVAYPMFRDPALSVSERYRDIQKQGLIKVKLPYGEPCWLATRYADVHAVFGDARFSRKLSLDHDAPGLMPSSRLKDPALLLNQDPPEHSRMRRLAAAPFTPAYAQGMQGWVQECVDDLLGDFAAAGKSADFVAHVSDNLSFRVLTKILGIPRDRGFGFRRWVEIVTAFDSDEQTKTDAAMRINAFIQELIGSKRVRRDDDLISALVYARDGAGNLSEEELFSLVLQFWVGGFKTSSWQLGSIVAALMMHPERWRELVEAPERVPAALEELWRWVPSFQYGAIFPRFAKEDGELSGGIVRAGEAILPESPIANRDETVFPNASQLDFHRIDPAQHLTFNHGAHKCIGQHVARLQIRLTVESLLRRFPGLELAVPQEKLRWSQSTMLRSVEALPLTW
jgi:cytochrome P450 RapN